MASKPVIVSRHTTRLKINDIVVKVDDKGRITDWVQLKKELETIGCNGRHFEAAGHSSKAAHHVCYLPGMVKVAI